MVATDYYAPAEPGAPARLRAYASFEAEELVAGARPFDLLGQGYFVIVIDQGQGGALSGYHAADGRLAFCLCGERILRSLNSCRPALPLLMGAASSLARLCTGVQVG